MHISQFWKKLLVECCVACRIDSQPSMFSWICATSLCNKCIKHCFLCERSVCLCLHSSDNFIGDEDMLLCCVLCKRECWLLRYAAKHLFEVVVGRKVCNPRCSSNWCCCY